MLEKQAKNLHKSVSALQKGFSHREGAKNAKVFKDEIQDLKSFSK